MEENKVVEVKTDVAEMENEVKKGGENLNDSAELLEELRALRSREAEWVFKEDLSRIAKAFPSDKVEGIEELGDDFLKMRSIGIDAVTAYAAIRQKKNIGKKNPPPSIGPVNASQPGEKEFYSPDEVRRMSREQISANLEKIEKSQKKWC